jgi:hypothetical protein
MCRAFRQGSQAIVFKSKFVGFFGTVEDNHCNLPVTILECSRFQFVERGGADNALGTRADKTGELADIVVGCYASLGKPGLLSARTLACLTSD